MSVRTKLAVVIALLVGAALFGWWRLRNRDGSGTPEVEARDALPSGKRVVDRGEAERSAPKHTWDGDGASVSGTITAAGKPIVAEVCAVPRDGALPRERAEPRCTKSAIDGRYRLEGLAPVETVIAASAPTFVAVRYRENDRDAFWLAPKQDKRNVDITLQPGGVEIRGVVRDISGGEIEGASVSTGQPWWGSQGFTVARTDEQGEFSLWVEPGNILVDARAEGYAHSNASGRVPGVFFELYLTPESVIVGRVVEAGTRSPVAGAEVRVGTWSAAPAYTDDAGNFRLDGLQPGTYKPVAKTTHGYGQAARSVHVGLGETSNEVVVELHPAAPVRAKIVVAETNGEPCPEPSASLLLVGTDIDLDGKAQPGGVLEWSGVLPGTYAAHVYCRNHVSAEKYEKVVVADAAIEVVWEVKRGRSIRGRLEAPEGLTLADASVNAAMIGGDPRAQRTSSWAGKVEPDGAFELRGLLPGTYEVNASARDFPRQDPVKVEVPAESDAEGVVVVMRAGGSIKGRVVDARGQAVKQASVRFQGPQWNYATADDAGNFEAIGLKPGEYRLTPESGSGALRKPGTTDDDVQGEAVVVEEGEVAEVELVVEARGGKIAGRVVDEAGGPISDAFIAAERESDSAAAAASRNKLGSRWGWREEPVLTDQDGAFTVDDLAEGSYTLRAYRRGGGEGFAENVRTGSTGVVVALAATGTIEGKVVIDGAAPPDRFEMMLRDKASGFSRGDDFFRTNGAFAIDELPPGKFEITVSCSAGDGRAEVTLAEGETKSGVEIAIEHRVVVKGRILDLDTGGPVAGVRVQLGTGSGGGFSFREGSGAKEEVTDASGVYEIAAAPVGRATLTVIPEDFFTSSGSTYDFTQRTVVVPDENPATLPDIEIVKRRVSEKDRAGDLGFTRKQTEAGTDHTTRAHVVAVIRPGGPADGSGLAIGDTIVEVDGHDVTGERSYLYSGLTEVVAGTTIELGLADDRTVKITAGKPL